jgi:type II secretory pathway component GspD/PulD (secretin)
MRPVRAGPGSAGPGRAGPGPGFEHHPSVHSAFRVPRVTRWRALACAALAASLLLACHSTHEHEGETPKSDETLTIDSFRDLIERGALHPVKAMENDKDFADPHPDTGEEPFEDAAKKLEAALGHPQKVEPGAPLSGSTSDATSVAPPQPAVQAPGPSSAQPPASPPIGPPAQPENPYMRFGKRIMVYPDQGLITKPFPLRVGLGAKLKKLLETYGRFPLYDVKDGPQKPTTVRIDLEEKWDTELFSDLRAALPLPPTVSPDGTNVNIADWLIVTTGFDLLDEVERFINIFAAGVPQIEIEAKIAEVTLENTLDLGLAPINSTTPIFSFPDHTFVRSLTYTLPNQAASTAANSLLTLGGIQDGVRFNAILQALATYDNVSIISRPKIAVREGGTAQILNTLKLPNYNVQAINAQGQVQAALSYEEVGIKLYVLPRVVGTQTVALNIDIESSAQSGSSVAFTLENGQTISNPIISRRAAKTVVYLEPGQAVILGGLISERTVDTENKVPFLGDIPLLGYFFKSTYKRKEQTNVLFFIRPRILQGTDLNRDF